MPLLSTPRAGAFAALTMAAFACAPAPAAPPTTAGAVEVPAPRLRLPLDGDFRLEGGAETVAAEGPHRFLRIGGRVGYHPTSRETALAIPTSLHQGNEGTITLWVSPLETLGVASSMRSFQDIDRRAQDYGILADTFPANHHEEANFSWRWRSFWHPAMIAKVVPGGRTSDYQLMPWVITEHLPLRQENWYQLTFTWNRAEHRLRLYTNGILTGTTDYPFESAIPNPRLFLGNTGMVFADLAIYDLELDASQVAAQHAAAGFPPDPEVEEELAALFTVRDRPSADWAPDASWELAYSASFTDPGDLADWRQQGSAPGPHQLKELGISEEGLLVQTADHIHNESRVYFWSEEDFEGDVAVQFDFRPESETGLALLVVHASGMQREDFIDDHEPRTSGAMGTIIAADVRNYHWEFFRRTGDVRTDLGTHVLVKNPWQRPLAMATRAPLALGEWHRLLFVKEGDRLRGAIDGEWVFDVRDDPLGGTGPVFNYGRIGLREMYQTRMRFRDLKVWERNPGVEVVSEEGRQSTAESRPAVGAGR